MSRRQLGKQPGPEEYQDRFPADAELIRSAFSQDARPSFLARGRRRRPRRPWPARPGPLPRGTVRCRARIALNRRDRPVAGKADLGLAALCRRDPCHRGVLGARHDRAGHAGPGASELLALRDADVEALQLLFDAHEFIASIAASDPRVRHSVRDLLARRDRDTAALLRSPELTELRAALGPWLGQYEYDGLRILDRQGHSIASSRDVTVGGPAGREEVECLDAVFAGRATVSRPRPSEVLLPDVDGKERLGLPTMFVLGPDPWKTMAGSSPHSAFGCGPSGPSRGSSTLPGSAARARPLPSIVWGCSCRRAGSTTTSSGSA